MEIKKTRAIARCVYFFHCIGNNCNLLTMEITRAELAYLLIFIRSVVMLRHNRKIKVTSICMINRWTSRLIKRLQRRCIKNMKWPRLVKTRPVSSVRDKDANARNVCENNVRVQSEFSDRVTQVDVITERAYIVTITRCSPYSALTYLSPSYDCS